MSSSTYSSHLDTLLSRYLTLLDTYLTLQSTLSTAQSTTFHYIARANWSAQRGIRYGQDFYDGRMKAIRCVEVDKGEGKAPRVRVVEVPLPEGEEIEVNVKVKKAKDESGVVEATLREPTDNANADADDSDIQTPESPEPSPSENTPKTIDPRNPLRWFGVLAPQPLKLAQNQSITTVDTVIPDLVNVRFELKQLEIEIGRTRKQQEKKLKAETEALKEAIEKTAI